MNEKFADCLALNRKRLDLARQGQTEEARKVLVEDAAKVYRPAIDQMRELIDLNGKGAVNEAAEGQANHDRGLMVATLKQKTGEAEEKSAQAARGRRPAGRKAEGIGRTYLLEGGIDG